MDAETPLALGYAGFLLLCAWALRRAAQRQSCGGRSLLRLPAPSAWARQEAARFQSVLSETLVLVAVLLSSVVAVRHREGVEIVPAALALFLALFAARGSVRRLRAWRRAGWSAGPEAR